MDRVQLFGQVVHLHVINVLFVTDYDLTNVTHIRRMDARGVAIPLSS